MHVRGALVATGLVLLASTALRADAPSNDGGIASDVANEKAIRALYSTFVKEWNAHDWQAIADLWTIDGDHMEPDGAIAKGRDAVAGLFKRGHDGGPFAKTHLQLSLADVWFIGTDVALVDGGYAISGIRTPDGTELPERRGHLTSVLIKEQGEWRITASRLMIPTELPYKSKPS